MIQFTEKVPIGDDGLVYAVPKIPSEKEIDGYKLASKKQKFQRQIYMPDKEFKQLSKESQVGIQERELKRRYNGYWFFNNGVPTYISGSHYFYLNYWYMAAVTLSGYPDYRSAQRLWAYFVDLCEKDLFCFGGIMMSGKRFSKTEFALAHLYNLATLVETDCLFGMQSLNATEARNNLFKSRILRSHRRIHSYLKPKSNDSVGTKQITSELTFMGDKDGDEHSEALNNVIDHRPTHASAYQGKRPREIYIDEAASIEEMDIYEALSTIKQQLQVGKKAFGKIYMPATLEAMTPKGAPLYQQIWEESDPNKRDKNGRTVSWLYRYFNPHFRGREDFIDEYGNDLEDEAKTFRANEIEVASPAKQTKIKRQYPETIQEAFNVIVTSVWEVDVKEILKKRLDFLKGATVPTKRVIFYEQGGAVTYFISDNPDAFILLEDPQPDVRYVIGVDGSGSDNETGEPDGSDFAFTVRKGFAGYGKRNYVPVGVFSQRPEKLDYIYSQLFLATKFFNKFGGCVVNVETNVGQGAGVNGYFSNRGASKLIANRPKQVGVIEKETKSIKGVYRNGEVKNTQIIIANRLLRQYGGDIEIIEVVQSYLNYEKENEDIADSDLMAILLFADFDKPAPKMANLGGRMKWQIITYQDGMFTRQKWIQVPA